jgi:Tol biopolymer transport system component
MERAKRWSSSAAWIALIAAAAHGQVTRRVSVDSSGAQGNGDSGLWGISISAGGRYVGFESTAWNLVRWDMNGMGDVFVHDRQSGATELVSVDSTGRQGNKSSSDPSISADGRYVAFESRASTLVHEDPNDDWDIFVHDRWSGTTESVSVASDGMPAGGSFKPSISADGRYVAFWSQATNLVSGDTNDTPDVFVRDRQSGTTERVSVASDGTQADRYSLVPSISGDGRYVAFYSDASNLVGGDPNFTWDVFVHDRWSGTTELVSVALDGTPAGAGFDPSISADGRYVAFESNASNLVGGDTNGDADIFVRDRQSGTTERVSVDSGGAQGNHESKNSSISADGRYVVFYSDATNLVGGDTNGKADVFVHDRQGSTTERMSVDSGGAQGNNESGFFGAVISADGRCVAFESIATNLVVGDTNLNSDVFVRDRGAGFGTNYCTANPNSTGYPADLSASGSASSAAGDLTLDAAPVPNQFGIFFQGANQAQVPFGNGFLCVTDDIARGTVTHAEIYIATYVYDNSDPAHSLAAYVGTTRNFQYWFRDPVAGGAFFNTSNAVSIAVLP